MKSPQKHINRLIEETSAYLLQHAHNPVDWFPWGEEAFLKASERDKPVLLSIGYSACHWCHVMERESFEDERIASLMNSGFVNIKVDMEERPDVDKIYMNFVQMTTGGGGWPMTVFLTPDQRPFFGGTYFPPSPRFNIPSFEQILVSVSDAWADRREEVLNSANEILGEIRRLGGVHPAESVITGEKLERAFESIQRTFDARNGGFGGAPKFPAPMTLEFLMRFHKRTGNAAALQIVELTCRKMASGGINDQLGGGFHRYTVDADWLTPHFEKMLYDNAQLVRCYLHLFQITKDEFYKNTASDVLEYVMREMLDPEGGFYSSQDADSEGVEGKFFVWTKREVDEILGDRLSLPFRHYYGITDEGNFEGKNILHVSGSIAETAKAAGLTEDEVKDALAEGKEKLFSNRAARVPPHKDDKVLTAWNGLMLSAFAEAAGVLDSDVFLAVAKKNADFLLDRLMESGRLLRTWKGGEAKLDAYLEDYANLADGLIELYQVDGEPRYLEEAKRLAETLISEFRDRDGGGFFFTANDHEQLLVRSKEFNDGATPAGNSAAADVLFRLSKIYGDQEFERHALTVLRMASGQADRFPGGFGRTLSTMELVIGGVKEIAVVGEKNEEIENVLRLGYLPGKVVVRTFAGEEVPSIPLLEGRKPSDGKTAVYVCEEFVCGQPVETASDLRELLGL